MNISDYKITADDYASLTYNVIDVPKSKDILKAFPALDKIPEFHLPIAIKNRDAVIRYIVLFYDKNTPLKKIEKEHERKMYAAMVAGIDYNEKTGLFPKDVEAMLRCKDGVINSLIISYLRHTSSVQYSTLVVGYEMFYQKLLAAIDHSKKGATAETARGKLWEQAMKMKKDLEGMAEQILTEKNPFLKDDLYMVVNKDIDKNLMIFPEDMVNGKA